jgi:hypothetical protein
MLGATTLETARRDADVTLLHRCVHGKTDFSLADIGVSLSTNNDRSGKLRFAEHHHANRISGGLFAHRAVREWNALPTGLTQTTSFNRFKLILSQHV